MKSLLILLFSVISFSLNADTFVQGHYRGDGTYVQPHMRSDPNDTVRDNWSTKGNVNPYTGEEGTRDYDSFNQIQDRQLQEENEYNSLEGTDIWD